MMYTFILVGDDFDKEVSLPVDYLYFDFPVDDVRIYQHGTETEEEDVYELNKLIKLYNSFDDYTQCKVEAIMEAFDKTIDRAIIHRDDYDFFQEEMDNFIERYYKPLCISRIRDTYSNDIIKKTLQEQGFIETSWGVIKKKEK